MQMAKELNCDFALVLTGETTFKDLNNINYDKCLVIENIRHLLEIVEASTL